MGLDVTLLSGHLLTEASNALWATPRTDRQIIWKASEPVVEWVRSNPGWPIKHYRSCGVAVRGVETAHRCGEALQESR